MSLSLIRTLTYSFVHKLMLSWILVSLACSPKLDPKALKANSSLDAKRELKDPKKAKLTLTHSKPKEAPASVGSKLNVPTLELSLDKADFVQILRCQGDYKLITSTGQDFESLDPSVDKERFKWMWNRAQGDYRSCKSVGLRVPRTTIQDLAAPSGTYYYVINPCVLAKNSITEKEECSYHLAKSETITYQSVINQRFLETSQKVGEQEADIASDVNDLINYAKMIADTQRSCEDFWASKEANKQRLRGFLKLGAMVLGTVVGGLITGGMGAIQGAQTFMGLAGGLLDKTMTVSMPQCPVAEQYRIEGARVFEALQPKIVQMIEIRKVLASINSDYAILNEEIKKDSSNEEPASELPSN